MSSEQPLNSQDLGVLYRKYEEQQLHESIYEEFSEDWTQKRRKPWYDLESELENSLHSRYRICLDAGCGSGRNISVLLNYAETIIGLDISIQQLKAIEDHFECENSSTASIDLIEIKLNPIVADIVMPPFRPNSIELIASVSTIHHLQGKETRIACIEQLLSIMDANGILFYTVWRFDIPRFSNWFVWHNQLFCSLNLQELPLLLGKKIAYGDVIVPWTFSKLNKIYYRYYHLFTETTILEELKELMKVKAIEIHTFPKEKNENFIVFIKNR